jgi:hypothetical protein
MDSRHSLVFIIRYAERRIDEVMDAAILDHTSVGGADSVQFESEWSFIRAFSGKKKAQSSIRSTPLPSQTPNGLHSPPGSISKGFSSLRESVSRARAGSSSTTPVQSLFPGNASPSVNYPARLLSFLTALHSLLTLSDINPAFTTQLWSQVMYWTSCVLISCVRIRLSPASRRNLQPCPHSQKVFMPV